MLKGIEINLVLLELYWKLFKIKNHMRCILALLLLIPCWLYSQSFPEKELMGKMISAMDNLKTARYSLRKQERFDGKILETEVIVKLNTHPLKVYVYSIKPNPGAEVLYAEGQNDGQVAVSANKFTYVTISMSPHNSLLRANQHHTILDMGFSALNKILKDYINKKGESFYHSLNLEGTAEWKGKEYFKLTLENKNFGYTTYDVKKREDLTDIAEKLHVSDFMILSLNPICRNYNDVRPGQRIKVPTAYAKRIVLYVDKQTYLPYIQFIYDDKGLFEFYEFNSFVLDPVISPQEFSTKYKGYKF
jgi:hypothetical protein